MHNFTEDDCATNIVFLEKKKNKTDGNFLFMCQFNYTSSDIRTFRLP